MLFAKKAINVPEPEEALQQALSDKLQQFKDHKKYICEDMPTGHVVLERGSWNEIPGTHVRTKISNFQAEYRGATVLDVVFDMNGKLDPHSHKSDETIICVRGTYFDYVNNVTLKEGDTQFIPRGKKHGGVSDDCLLIVIWRPPLDMTEA